MQLPGKIKRGRPKRRYLDEVKENMQEVEAREDEVFDRSVCTIRCCDPGGNAERRRRFNNLTRLPSKEHLRWQ